VVRRLVAFTAALVLAGAPIVVGVCQAVCAAHDMESAQISSSAQRHSCHGASPASGAALQAVPHPCGHSGEFPVSIDQCFHPIDAPAIAVAIFSFLPPIVDGRKSPPVDFVQNRPNLLALTSQLRV